MRVSFNQFVKEVSGGTGTLCAVLFDNTTFFAFEGLKARLNTNSISMNTPNQSFTIPRKHIYSIEKTSCETDTVVEYEISIVQGGSIVIDIQ